MIKLGLFLWAVFFAVLAFSMMPGSITLVAVISFIGGIFGARHDARRKKSGIRINR